MAAVSEFDCIIVNGEMTVKTRIWLMVTVASLLLLATACSAGKAALNGDGQSVLPVVDLRGVDNKGAGLEPGVRAPDFALAYPDGSRSTLADLRGQPVVVNFWATWCAPCRAEMPELVDAYQQHKDEGLVVIGVNEQEGEDEAVKFMEEFGIDFPVVLDSRGDLASLYTARGLPTTIFIDRDGNISEQWRGILTADLLAERLATLLEQ